MGQLRLNDRVYTGQASGDGFHVYSTNEQIVGKWIDGKPLYEKTIDCGAMPNNASKTVGHGISNLKMVVDCRGGASSSEGLSIPLPYVQTSSSLLGYQTNIYVDTSDIHITTKDNVSAYTTSYLTLRYTKTTD